MNPPVEGEGPAGWDGDRYQQRFDALAASGVDVHGEADLVADLAPTSVLDAGCGTGRVARELARRGVEVVGVDVDQSMVATARRLAPEITWLVGDITQLDLGRRFDVVLMAGNVPIFAAEGSHQALVAGCARHVAVRGALVAGFQLGPGYPLAAYDEHCRQAGLACVERWATWSRDPFAGGDYAVSIHRFAAEGGRA
ncbi:MAG TPA: class I SAM-dependent methyltransferase [Acidimicrobiales bacterium]|nr:class I SAM-dependent methyltransferase [Acidimicrobiales bacterium]